MTRLPKDEDDAAAAARTGLRELRLVVADPRSRAVRRRVGEARSPTSTWIASATR